MLRGVLILSMSNLKKWFGALEVVF
jgi:hypothetical protein